MDRQDFAGKQAAYATLGRCQAECPTGLHQQAFAALYNDMVAEGTPWPEIRVNLIHALHDGVAYGNWPGGLGPLAA